MAAYVEIPILKRTHKAGGTLVADRFVKSAAALVQTVAGDNAIGVVKVAAVSGDIVPVDIIGDTIVESGAAVAVDDLIQSDASGRAITKAAGATLGRALTLSTGVGVKILVALIQN